MPVERYNLSGQQISADNAELTPQRANGQDFATQDEILRNDSQAGNDAENFKEQGKLTESRAAANRIIDPATRIRVYRELFGQADRLAPPSAVYTDGYTGINDPLSLFFMMVFYLDK